MGLSDHLLDLTFDVSRKRFFSKRMLDALFCDERLDEWKATTRLNRFVFKIDLLNVAGHQIISTCWGSRLEVKSFQGEMSRVNSDFIVSLHRENLFMQFYFDSAYSLASVSILENNTPILFETDLRTKMCETRKFISFEIYD